MSDIEKAGAAMRELLQLSAAVGLKKNSGALLRAQGHVRQREEIVATLRATEAVCEVADEMELADLLERARKANACAHAALTSLDAVIAEIHERNHPDNYKPPHPATRSKSLGNWHGTYDE